MPNRITSWLKSYFPQHKIDFMSLNRLRQNQTVSSTIPVRIAYTEKTRMAENLLWVRSHDTSITFDTMELVRNPFGITPLTALAIFHTDAPTRLSYTVESASAEPWHYEYDSFRTTHVAPILGLCPDTVNTITLCLYRQDEKKPCCRKFQLQTDPLPADYSYPMYRDERGTIRYFLAIPSCDAKMIPLSEGHFLLVNDKIRTRTGQKPLPTHLYEVDLLGRCYRTYYVGNGIYDAFGEISPDNPNLLVLAAGQPKKDTMLVEIDRETGAILPASSRPDTSLPDCAINLERKYFDALFQDSLEQFSLAGEALDQIKYPTTGWLLPPVFYKAASVETSSAVDLDYLKDRYELSFGIVGDSLMVDTIGDQIQEIVFSRAERIYQLDLTNPPALDDQYANYRYTFAVPLTEMYSGTYSIVIRFRNGGQEVLKDTLTLSRARS